MKVTLEFSEEHQDDALIAMRAWDYRLALLQFVEDCRRTIKNSDNEFEIERAEWARDAILKEVQERSLDLY
jgi:hypothetical protein